jgi:hypothetical protein
MLLVFPRAAHAQSADGLPSVDPAFAAALWMASAGTVSPPDAMAKPTLTREITLGPRLLGGGLGMLTGAGVALAMLGRTVDPCGYDEPVTPKVTWAAGGATMALGAFLTALGAYKMNHQTSAQRTAVRGSPGERTKIGLLGWRQAFLPLVASARWALSRPSVSAPSRCGELRNLRAAAPTASHEASRLRGRLPARG